jgi:hypothetical protein
LDVINPLPELRAIIDQRKAVISQSGFDGKSIAESLRQIRNGDPHLAECCPTLLHLARHLSFNFIHDCTLLLRQGGNDPQIDQLYESFLKLTYEQGPFRRAAFTHVFNLDIDGRDVTIENFRIIRLNPDSKSELLKEDGISRYIHPFLHPQGVGDCFIYANEGANDQNDDSWLQAKHAEATRFVMLLQYFKDGVVHVGYTVPRFYPDWAHQIRYEGLYLIGTPRRTAHSHGGLNTKSRRLKFPRFQDIGLLFPHRTYQQ